LEQSPLAIQTTESVPRPVTADPYTTEVPKQLLSRKTLIGQLTWSNGWAGKDYGFPQDLAPTALSGVLAKYRYFRADVEIEVKVQSTPYHQGQLIVGWISDWLVNGGVVQALPPTNASTVVDTWLLSGMNSQLLSASKQESCKFTIPWRSPCLMHDTEGTGTNLGGIIGAMFIRELNPIIASQPNQAASVPVMVWAQYVNIKLAGFKSNSGKTNPEAHAKSQQFDAKTAVSVASKIVKRLPIIDDAWGFLADTVGSFLGMDLNKPTNTESSTQIMNTYQPQCSLSEGIQYAQPLSQYANPYVWQAETVNGMETSHMAVSKLAQKPMLMATGVFTTSTTSMTIACHTMQTATTGCTLSPIGDWLQNVGLPFVYWRGSIKYAIQFVLPAFYSCRARVYVSAQNAGITDVADLPQQVVDIKGDTWVTLMVPYLYTSMWRRHRGDAASTQIPTLHIDLITSIMGSALPAVPIMYCNIFRAGGEDTQFAQLRGVRVNGIFKSDSSIDQMFSKPFEGLIQCNQGAEIGFCMAEQVKTVSDCLKRDSSWLWNTSTDGTHPMNFLPGALFANWALYGGEPYNYFPAFYRYWRGGRIIGHHQPTQYVSLNNDGANVTYGDGAGCMFFTSNTNVVYNHEKVHVHYMAPQPYVPMNYAWSQYFDTESLIDIDTTLWNFPSDLFGVPNGQNAMMIAGADDFMCLCPVPMFPVHFNPVNFSLALNLPKEKPVDQQIPIFPQKSSSSTTTTT